MLQAFSVGAIAGTKFTKLGNGNLAEFSIILGHGMSLACACVSSTPELFFCLVDHFQFEGKGQKRSQRRWRASSRDTIESIGQRPSVSRLTPPTLDSAAPATK